jgi:hypothetical protein
MMSLHLAEISRMVAPGAHAVVLMDQAGWHTTGKLIMPRNISIPSLRHKAKFGRVDDSEIVCDSIP